jgi:8-oxo-dGTP pyrophosphatase MutT (NUDIX family)
MGFVDHIRRCNAHAPEDFVPWSIAGEIAGYVRLKLRPVLAGYAGLFVDEDGLALDPRHADAPARTAALAETVERLHRAGLVRHVTGEAAAVILKGRRVAAIERGALDVLGIESAGCHLNGVVRRPDGMHLWIARRSATKRTYPNLLDNFVAGGHPDGLSVIENLVKECGEEAGLPPDLARRAVPVGIISYVMANEPDIGDGLSRHVLHCFDLELPDDFRPTAVDGEIAEFRLMPVSEVAAIIESDWSFKFNCALVVIDFMVRHGLIGPGHPDYVEICRGLRR